MNTRVYPPEIYQKALNDLLGKKYCPHCYSDTKKITLSYSSLNIRSSVRNVKRCECCKKVLNDTELLNKQDIRNKKIEEVLKK